MSSLVRWCKFNLVGMIGVAVQFGVLWLLHRRFAGHDASLTAIAVEAALIHNFLWHRRFTWRDRTRSSALPQFLRFQLSSGSVSLAGNIVITQLALRHAHLSLWAANVVAILACSVVNFVLAHRWAFTGTVRKLSALSDASGEQRQAGPA